MTSFDSTLTTALAALLLTAACGGRTLGDDVYGGSGGLAGGTGGWGNGGSVGGLPATGGWGGTGGSFPSGGSGGLGPDGAIQQFCAAATRACGASYSRDVCLEETNQLLAMAETLGCVGDYTSLLNCGTSYGLTCPGGEPTIPGICDAHYLALADCLGVVSSSCSEWNGGGSDGYVECGADCGDFGLTCSGYDWVTCSCLYGPYAGLTFSAEGTVCDAVSAEAYQACSLGAP